MKKVLICAAIPRELKYIEKPLSSLKSKRSAYGNALSIKTKSIEVILHRTGIGIHSAESSIRPLLDEFHPDLMISLGFGGALDKGLNAGDLVWASRVFFLPGGPAVNGRTQISDISLPEPKSLADGLSRSISFRQGCIITLERPMTKSEIKNNLPGGILFPVCDMETFALANSAVQRRIPFIAVRSISDTADQEVPGELFDVTHESGKIAYRRLIKSVFKKPGLVKDLIRLGVNSEKAAKSLGGLLRSLLDTAFINEQ